MSRTLVLLSGGKDSAVALWWAKENYGVVTSLSIHHPDRPHREMLAARRLSSAACSELIEVDLPFVRSAGSLQASHGTPFDTATAYMPMRNLLFFAVAAHFAEASGMDRIVAGQLRSDGIAYTDATPSFFDGLTHLFQITLAGSFTSESRSLTIDLPLIALSDEQAIELGRRLGVPFDLTWSCLHEGKLPCNRCVSCRDRSRALAHVRDSVPESRG
jgi:7-cyano-7-deazaguanine synthase